MVDVDSKIPNLALMKLSAYHKAKGDKVGFGVDNPDLVYVSIIFPENRNACAMIPFQYPDAKLVKGGPGWEATAKLPEEVERTPPDQDLYNSKFSIGRVTSGCPRKCSFCVVNKLEPEGIRYIQPPADIWKEGTILRLLDDNIFALPKAFDDVYEFCTEHKITLHAEYFDIRLLTPTFAKQLKDLKHDTGIWFSYDLTGIEKSVRAGVKMLEGAGINLHSVHFFLYLHDEEMIPDAQYRWGVLRELGVEPFLMVNKDNLTRRLKRVRRRGCRPAIWRNLTTEEVFQ